MEASNQGEERANDQPTEARWPGIPLATQHRVSMKWMSIEALRVLVERLQARDIPANVMLFTAHGWFQGTLCDIAQHYDEAVSGSAAEDVDIASASVHLRTQMMQVYSQHDEALQSIDNGAIVRLKNVTVQDGNRKLHLPNIALFASEIIAFSLRSHDES